MPRLSHEALIHEGASVENSTLGRFTEVGQGARVANSVLGDYSYCDRMADIANAVIGKFANIASLTRIGPTDHPMHKASLHHFLYRSGDYWDDAGRDDDWFAHRASRVVSIGHDTWIGHGAIVRPELSIGDGAVIGAGAVVTRDVAPYTIVAGVPAVMIRRRYPVEIAVRMQAIAWWDWEHDRLRAALDDFRTLSAEAFVERHETAAASV